MIIKSVQTPDYVVRRLIESGGRGRDFLTFERFETWVKYLQDGQEYILDLFFEEAEDTNLKRALEKEYNFLLRVLGPLEEIYEKYASRPPEQFQQAPSDELSNAVRLLYNLWRVVGRRSDAVPHDMDRLFNAISDWENEE